VNAVIATAVTVELDGSPSDGTPVRYWLRGPDGESREISGEEFNTIYRSSIITNRSNSLTRIVEYLSEYGERTKSLPE
jgi:hypothetical protein